MAMADDLFQWVSNQLAHERSELELSHKKLLKELSQRVIAPRGPMGVLEQMKLIEPEPNDALETLKLDLDTNKHPPEEENLEEVEHNKRVSYLAPAPDAAEMAKVVAASNCMEEEMRDEEATKRQSPKKEQSELSSTLRRKSKAAKALKLNLLRPKFIANSPYFELTYAICIMLHAMLMAADLQYRAMDVGHLLSYDGFTQTGKEAFPAMEQIFDVLEWIFGILFMVEAIIKLLAMRKAYFKETWNWFDLLLVLMWVADRAMENLPFDTSLLRLLRLARLIRLVKLARTVQGFDALAVMTTSLRGSTSALLWVAVLLCLVQMTFALLMSQVLMFYMENDSLELSDRKDVFEYFGNFTRSFLTMFEITLGNWPPVARLLQEKVSSWFVIFSVSHKIIFGFACVAVINGVFMQETFKVAQQDDQIMLRTVETKRQAHRRKMQMFFQHANDDGDNQLSIAEWKEVLEEEK
ncbi:unnamed protein product, partial [Effrenium voratum]